MSQLQESHPGEPARPLETYYCFEFATVTEHSAGVKRLRQYLKRNADFGTRGPGPVMWSTLMTARPLAIYLNGNAVRAASRSGLVVSNPARLVAARLPKGLILVFGDEPDANLPGGSSVTSSDE